MLLNYSQFNLKYAVKAATHFLNPPVTLQENVELPRQSVIHYLDTSTDAQFPTTELVYLRGTPKNKRIPVCHVTDLRRTEETIGLLDRYVDQRVRGWARENQRQFRVVDLLSEPNTDTQVNAIFNYNSLKSMYKYQSTLTAAYSKYNNLYGTVWDTVHEAIAKDTESNHFVTLALPNSVPSRNVIEAILKFSPSKFIRVVNNEYLNGLIQLYQWLSVKTRANSTMSSITEEDSRRIVIEFLYKGHSCFFRLSDLLSLSQESGIPSRTKFAVDKLQRLFLITVLKVQGKVIERLEAIKPAETEESIQEPSLSPLEAFNDDGETDDTSMSVNDDTPEPLISDFSKKPNGFFDGVRPNKKEEVTDNLVFSETFSGLIDSVAKDLEGGVDDVFIDNIQKVADDKTETIQDAHQVDYSEEHLENLLRNKTIESKFTKYVTTAKLADAISSSEARSLKKLFEARQQLSSPYGDGLIDVVKKVTSDDLQIKPEETKLTVKNDLVDDSLKTELLFKFDEKYLKTIYRKDVLACVTQLENANIVVKDYEVTEELTAVNHYEVHKLTLKPLGGKESTIYFRLPVVNKEGEFVASGVKYRMRKQRADLVLRKISPTRVAITSNYTKLFVFRTDRKAYDKYAHIIDKIKTDYLEQGGMVKKLTPGNTYDNKKRVPNIIANLSKEFKEFSTSDYTFVFDESIAKNQVNETTWKSIHENKDRQYIGYTKDKQPLVADYHDRIYTHGDNTFIGYLEDLIGLDKTKIPKNFSAIKILGDNIPLGVVMAYYLGLNNLFAVTKTSFTLLEPRKQYQPTDDEIVLRFSDHKVVVNAKTEEQKLLFSGFLFYKDFTKLHSLDSFYGKEIYLDMVEHWGATLMHLKELDLLEDLFLDPISVDVLASMNEPTDYLKLLLRANNMLSDFSHPDINDPDLSRIRGYDRIPGLMYRALAESVRAHRFKGHGKGRIELDPYKVWNAVTQDTTVKICEDSNPVLDVKEAESGTFAGADGLSKTATPAKMRRYHPNDAGLISESTVDSTDVALNFFLTPYAKITDLRGNVDKTVDASKDPAKMFSTSMLLSPFGESDDPKRMNFTSIQNGHTIAADGYTQPLIRTGYEYLMPYKVGKLHCVVAPQNGKVISVTDKLLTVKYADDTTEAFMIGSTYGRMEGSVYKHAIVTELTEGKTFKKDDYLAYNTGFFEKDWLDSSRLVMKFNRVVTTALSVGDEVYEDSSAISQALSKQMASTVLKEKVFVIEFNKNIIGMIPEGTRVHPNDVLFTIVDENSDYSNLSESSIEMLRSLANISPKAKVDGTIFKYEVKYNGEFSDMSPTVRKLVNQLDKELQESTKGTDTPLKGNRVTSEYRSEGKNLLVNTLELKVFVETKLQMGSADKGSFGSQMKSVVSGVFPGDVTTASGVPVDAMFSYTSILNRIVLSPILMGTTNRLLKHVSPMVADAYFK